MGPAQQDVMGFRECPGGILLRAERDRRRAAGLNRERFLSSICTLTPFWGGGVFVGLNRDMGDTLTGHMGCTASSAF